MDIEILKRSELLGKLTQDNFTIAVRTHGKTTTSSILKPYFV